MNKLLITSLIITTIWACNNDNAKKEEASTKPNATAVVDFNKNPDYAKGVELVGKSDCLTCHKINEKSIGPSYKDIAIKYADKGTNYIDTLAGKIISGGNGVWGQVAMTPHPSLSKADAVAMTKYIMLLKDAE